MLQRLLNFLRRRWHKRADLVAQRKIDEYRAKENTPPYCHILDGVQPCGYDEALNRVRAVRQAQRLGILTKEEADAGVQDARRSVGMKVD